MILWDWLEFMREQAGLVGKRKPVQSTYLVEDEEHIIYKTDEVFRKVASKNTQCLKPSNTLPCQCHNRFE